MVNWYGLSASKFLHPTVSVASISPSLNDTVEGISKTSSALSTMTATSTFPLLLARFTVRSIEGRSAYSSGVRISSNPCRWLRTDRNHRYSDRYWQSSAMPGLPQPHSVYGRLPRNSRSTSPPHASKARTLSSPSPRHHWNHCRHGTSSWRMLGGLPTVRQRAASHSQQERKPFLLHPSVRLHHQGSPNYSDASLSLRFCHREKWFHSHISLIFQVNNYLHQFIYGCKVITFSCDNQTFFCKYIYFTYILPFLETRSEAKGKSKAA